MSFLRLASMIACLALAGVAAIPVRAADPGGEPAGPPARSDPTGQSSDPAPVNGLKLTLSAEKIDLQMRPLQPPPVMADTPAYICQRTELKLTFQNVSDKPIKLDLYELAWQHLKQSVTGPDDKSVKIMEWVVSRKWVEPQAGDYPVLEPGKTHSVKTTFPGPAGDKVSVLMRPGRYSVTLTYGNTAPPFTPPGWTPAWTGSVTSNAVQINALPPGNEPLMGEPADGLALGLALPKYGYTVGEQVKPTVVLRNVSDKPMLALPRGLRARMPATEGAVSLERRA